MPAPPRAPKRPRRPPAPRARAGSSPEIEVGEAEIPADLVESQDAKRDGEAPTADAAAPDAAAPDSAVPSSDAPSSETPDSETPRSSTLGLDFDSIPRLDFEDDAEVDPTRVGAAAAIDPDECYFAAPCKKIVFDEEADEDEPTRTSADFLVYATAQTDRGLRRKRNEDSLLTLEAEGLFAVADGMGGYSGGAIASAVAVKTLGDAYQNKRFAGVPHDELPRRASELARAIQMANTTILRMATRDPTLKGMGTTVCAALFSANKRRLFIGHVGDSRCYRMRSGALKQITVDHTMRDLGVTGPESAHLSRALGVWPAVPIDLVLAIPAPGDVYLLCSDGLTKMLPDETIATVLRSEEDPKSAVERLVFFANARGGKDNVTVVLVRVVSAAERKKLAEKKTVAPLSATERCRRSRARRRARARSPRSRRPTMWTARTPLSIAANDSSSFGIMPFVTMPSSIARLPSAIVIRRSVTRDR